MKIILLLAIVCIFHIGKAQFISNETFANTFSIVARDSITGEMGIAVQSHAFSVGTIVTWGEAGVGVIATQALVNRSYGSNGLNLLRDGKSPGEVVQILTESDLGRDNRQVAVLDINGRTASYTGINCIASAGHFNEKNFSVQGNMLLNDDVIPAMIKSFKESKGALAERMIAAMEAGQNAGGDVRGQQSAALLIVNPVASGLIWKDRYIDLRVEDHPEPVKELKRLLQIFRAWEYADAGETALGRGDTVTAAKEYGIAEALLPTDTEIKFWHAVILVNTNRINDALPLFKRAFEMDANWALLLARLRKAGVLTCNEATEKLILSMNEK